jgi:hypothetical protein
MNPYAAPGSVSAVPAEEDIAAATPPTIARAAGGLVVLAALVVALTGVQTLAIVTVRGSMELVPYALVALGAPGLVLGAKLYQARAWAVLAALGQTTMLVLASSAWLVFSVTRGLFSLFALGGPFCAVAALVTAILAVGPCQRASAARARLKAQGLNLGI